MLLVLSAVLAQRIADRELKWVRASPHPSPVISLMLFLLRRTPFRGPLPHVALKAQPTPGLVAQDSHTPTPPSLSVPTPQQCLSLCPGGHGRALLG